MWAGGVGVAEEDAHFDLGGRWYKAVRLDLKAELERRKGQCWD